MKNGFKYSRYAHSEGHTALRYTRDGKYILTCGTDSDVRVWPSNGLEDDSPSSVTLRESATSLVECNNVLFIGSGHFVEAYKYPELKYSEKPLRFTATVTDVDISSDGKILAAGSCDMKIKMKNLVTQEITELCGHTGPIFRVVFSLDTKYLASSSGDGSVRAWDTSTGALLRTFSNIMPTINDFNSAISLGSPAWFDTSHLVIIKDRNVCFHNVIDWSFAFQLTSPKVKKSISVISVADHRLLLCAGTTVGEIIVWNVKDRTVVKYLEDSDKVAIRAVSWSPTRIEFACCDQLGRLHVTSAEEFDEINDPGEDFEKSDRENIDEDCDNENEISINDIKASVPLLQSRSFENDNEVCDAEADYPIVTIEIDIQCPFQPSSTPSDLEHGYMVWNSIGVVRRFNDEEVRSIDVEFHDTMLHHSIHKRNLHDYVMASLSCKVLCLASTCMLTCIHLNAWDDKKEWSLDIPQNEKITAVASSGNWVCCATNLNQLRFYSCTGMQRQVVSLPGPVVCINGHEKLLIVVVHLGPGLNKCQNMGWTVFEVTDFFVRAITPFQPMPLSPESKLRWAGFTDEGTPCTHDSAGILRFSRDFRHWEVACNTQLHCKNKSDNYFAIGVSERLQCLRCILCKGTWYPMTLPRPTVVEVPLKIPLCHPDENKTVLEDIFWRHVFSLPVFEEPSRENDEYRMALIDTEKLLKQTIIKLFAEAYRNRADMRAVSLASLMSEQPLEMAMKLVQGDGRLYLADKLVNITPKDWNDLRQRPTHYANTSNYVGLVDYSVERYNKKEIKNKYTHKSQGDMFELSQPSVSTGSRILVGREWDLSQEERSNACVSSAALNVNPFKVQNKEDPGPKGLNFFNNVTQSNLKPIKPEATINEKASKSGRQMNQQKPKTNSVQKMKFFDWFKINKSSLQESYPDLGMNELIKRAMQLYKEEVGGGGQNQRGLENVDEGTENSPENKRQKIEF